LIHQRVFVPDGCAEAWRQAHAVASPIGSCSWLRAGPGAPGGVQAHAIAGAFQWEPLRDETGATAGWVCRNGKMRWASIGGLCRHRRGSDALTARDALAAGERLLSQAGMGLGDVARTWFFLDDILGWYAQFNTGRNHIFRQRGLLRRTSSDGPAVPASTGIGVSPACGSRLAMEMFGVAGETGCVVRNAAAGKQRCAYEYGSAFARVAQARTPAGRTVFVSGTAAINAQGQTCFIDDAPAQIRMTLENVQAVLSDSACGSGDVVQAMAYCKTPAIAAQFTREFQMTPPWPWVVVVGDVCRDDLLFEVEVTAARAESSENSGVVK
jgi:enamine deaminase RidA (YjgF/YER057c/UK114 family)